MDSHPEQPATPPPADQPAAAETLPPLPPLSPQEATPAAPPGAPAEEITSPVPDPEPTPTRVIVPEAPAPSPVSPPVSGRAASVPNPAAHDAAITSAPLSVPAPAPEEVVASGWSSSSDPDPEPVHAMGFSAQGQAAIAAIEEGLRAPNCTQIDGYGPGQLSAQVNGRHALIQGHAFANADEYQAWLRQMVENSGSVVDWAHIESNGKGVLELRDGSRLTIILPPIARPHAQFSLRKHTAIEWTAEKFIELETMDERMLNFLRVCVASHVNILFVGQMGSGKSTMLRALLQDAAGDDERIMVVEQVPELAVNKPLVMHQLYLPTVEGQDLHSTLDMDLYMGLDRLVVGETHLEGLTKMLETMIYTEGSMSTYHAFSTEQAGERMKLGLQLEHGNVSAVTAASLVRNAIELVVVLEKLGSKRRVLQITEIDWRTSSGDEKLGGANIFTWDREDENWKAENRPSLGRVRAKLEKYGLAVSDSWFLDPEDYVRASAAGLDLSGR